MKTEILLVAVCVCSIPGETGCNPAGTREASPPTAGRTLVVTWDGFDACSALIFLDGTECGIGRVGAEVVLQALKAAPIETTLVISAPLYLVEDRRRINGWDSPFDCDATLKKDFGVLVADRRVKVLRRFH